MYFTNLCGLICVLALTYLSSIIFYTNKSAMRATFYCKHSVVDFIRVKLEPLICC